MVKLGFTPALALHTIMVIADYTNGFVLQEQALQSEPSTQQLEMLARLPTLREAFRTGGYRQPDAAFEHGLDVMVAGTTAILTP